MQRGLATDKLFLSGLTTQSLRQYAMEDTYIYLLWSPDSTSTT